MQLKPNQRGFTLTEIAIVFAIVALLIASAMMTLSARIDQSNQDETHRRLNTAIQDLIAFAIVNGRLPCPAVSGSNGYESPTTLPSGGGTCTAYFNGVSTGFLPARTIGFQPINDQGYGVDPWGNPIRYAVSNAVTGCTGSSNVPPFTSAANLKANGVSCKPNDIDIFCTTVSPGIPPTCTPTTRVVTSDTVVAVVFSTGKDGSITSAYGSDETQNVSGSAKFVSRTPSGSNSSLGNYDDIMAWLPAGVFYAKLIEAGKLP